MVSTEALDLVNHIRYIDAMPPPSPPCQFSPFRTLLLPPLPLAERQVGSQEAHKEKATADDIPIIHDVPENLS